MRTFDYLSDEVICVDVSPLGMCGFARPISLKAGSRFVIQEWLQPEARIDRLWKDVCWIDPAAFGEVKVIGTVCPAAIVFPRYVPNVPLRVQRLGRAEALTRLMRLYVNRAKLPEAGFRMAAQIARLLPSWELEFSKALDAAEWLEDLLANPQGSQDSAGRNR